MDNRYIFAMCLFVLLGVRHYCINHNSYSMFNREREPLWKIKRIRVSIETFWSINLTILHPRESIKHIKHNIDNQCNPLLA